MTKKKLSIFFISFMLLFSFNISNVTASDQFLVDGGQLTISSHSAVFDTDNNNWQIALGGAMNFETTEQITVTDLTGTNAGWNFTVNFNDFTNSTQITDPTESGATLNVTLPVDKLLSFALFDDNNELFSDIAGGGDLTPTTDNGTPVTPSAYTVNNIIADATGLNVLNVDPGYGAGEFDFNINYAISGSDWLPDDTVIRSSADSGVFASSSPVTVNNESQKYQIFAGTYETTITYSVSGNPA